MLHPLDEHTGIPGGRGKDTPDVPLPVAMAPRLHADDPRLQLGSQAIGLRLHLTEDDLQTVHSVTVKLDGLHRGSSKGV